MPHQACWFPLSSTFGRSVGFMPTRLPHLCHAAGHSWMAPMVVIGLVLEIDIFASCTFLHWSFSNSLISFQADFHLCLVPLRVIAYNGCVNIVYYLFLASDVLTCILHFSLDMQQVDADMLLRNKKVLPLRRFGIRGT